MIMATSTTTNPFESLTAVRFRDALARHVDVSKPDPLARGQMEALRLDWDQESSSDADGELIRRQHSDGRGQHSNAGEEGHLWQWSLRGTLTLSSEYISVAIHVTCNCKLNCGEGKGGNDSYSPMNQRGSEKDIATNGPIPNERFKNEFYIRLTVNAKLMPAGDHAHSSTKEAKGEEKSGRKERAAKRKIRAEMKKRLCSDPLIRRLLTEEDADRTNDDASTEKKKMLTTKQKHPNNGDGLPLCEALIQQNQTPSLVESAGNVVVELEERVNVHENSLEGMRNALFGHCEDNLDVLEILLGMPYLPRSTGGSDSGAKSANRAALSTLAERTHLRLLEDAMFDACEREGEDELLDDLEISDTIHDDCGRKDDSRDGVDGKGRGKKGGKPKRMKPSDGRWR